VKVLIISQYSPPENTLIPPTLIKRGVHSRSAHMVYNWPRSFMALGFDGRGGAGR